MTEQDALKRIKCSIDGSFKRQGDAAKSLGISPQFLSMVLKGRKRPTAQILAMAGLERIEYSEIREKE